MFMPQYLSGLVVFTTFALITGGCSSNDSSANDTSRGGRSPAVTASGRVDGGTDRVSGNGGARQSLAFPTGDRATSLVWLQANGPEQVRLGQPYTYTLTVTNLTDTPLHNVRVENLGRMNVGSPTTRPSGNVARLSSPNGGDARTAGARTAEQEAGADAAAHANAEEEEDTGARRAAAIWEVGTLGPKETKTQQLNGTADELGTIGNCLSVTYRPTLCVMTKVVKPELSVTKEGPSQVLICQPVTYTYRVTNTGTGAIQNVQLQDNLPEGLATADGGRVFRADIGTLREGESKTATAQLKATRTGSFASRATARSGDIASASREVTTAVKEPALAVNVEGPEAQYVGQAINFRVTVRNTSDTPAANTVVALSAVGGNERIADRNIGTIPPGGSQSFAVNIGAGRGAGNASLTAAARADCARPAQASASVQILTIPALLLECVDSVDPVPVGGNTVYTITVINQGSGADSNVGIKAILPPELQFVRGGGASDVRAEGNTLTFAPIATIAPKQNLTWTVECKAVKAADARFYVELTSGSLSRPAAETEPTRITTGDAAKDIHQGLPVTPAGGRGPATQPGATPEGNK